MKAEAQEEARRWQQEQEAELRRKEAMKLSDEERLDILQVNNSCFLNNYIHCIKRLSFFPPLSEMSLTKLSLACNY
jgi:hypothetical protein